MGAEDFFGFDDSAYRRQVDSLEQDSLQREHAIIRQKCMGAKASAGAGLAGAVHTGGSSLIFSGIGLRRNHYNKKKLAIVEARLRREGWPISDLRKRDILLAVGPSAVAACIAPGADALTSHLAGHGAETFLAQHTAETVNAAMLDPGTFAHAVEQGFSAQVGAVSQGMLGNATALVPVDEVARNTVEFFGDVTGQSLAATMETGIAKGLGDAGTRYVLRRSLNGKIIAPTTQPVQTTWRGSPKFTAMTTHVARSTSTVTSRPEKQWTPTPRLANELLPNLTRPSDLDLRVCLLALLPPLLASIIGPKLLCAVHIALTTYLSFVVRLEKLPTIWTITLILALIALTTPSPAHWLLTFCFQTWSVAQIKQDMESVGETLSTLLSSTSIEQTNRRWPLLFAAMGLAGLGFAPLGLRVSLVGAVGMCFAILMMQSLPGDLFDSDSYMLNAFVDGFKRCDVQALALVPALLYTSDGLRLLLIGCIGASLLNYAVQCRAVVRRKKGYVVACETWVTLSRTRKAVLTVVVALAVYTVLFDLKFSDSASVISWLVGFPLLEYEVRDE